MDSGRESTPTRPRSRSTLPASGPGARRAHTTVRSRSLRDPRSRHGQYIQMLFAEEIRCSLSISITPMSRFLAISGTASSERTSDWRRCSNPPWQRHSAGWAAASAPLPHHPLAHGNARALDLGRMADLEPHAQFVRPLIQQKNGKDAVGKDSAHQLRGAAEQVCRSSVVFSASSNA